MGVPPPPTIEGSLKNTLNAIGFGLITAVLVVNFGKMFISNFFVWLMVAVVIIEIFLLAVTKKRHDYEVYQAPGRKGKHTIEGAGTPQITVEPPSDGNYDLPKKKHGIRDRLRKDKTGKRESKAGLEPAADGGYYDEDGSALTPTKLSPKLERKASKAVEAEAKAEKKLEKAEEKAKEKAKGMEEAEGKGKETDAEDGEKEKSKSKGWRKRLHRKSQGESD